MNLGGGLSQAGLPGSIQIDKRRVIQKYKNFTISYRNILIF